MSFASTTTYGRYRACRPLGTAYGLAAGSAPPPSALSQPGATRLQSTVRPQRPRKTRGIIPRVGAPSSVSRSPLDCRRSLGHLGEGVHIGNPHRPQALRLLPMFIGCFSAFSRFSRRAAHAPSPEHIVRSPRCAQITPAPTRQSSCRGTRQNSCRCTSWTCLSGRTMLAPVSTTPKTSPACATSPSTSSRWSLREKSVLKQAECEPDGTMTTS